MTSPSPSDICRHERSFAGFSRGAELAAAILDMRNPARPYSPPLHVLIEALLVEYDLTYPEWYAWSAHVGPWRRSSQTAVAS